MNLVRQEEALARITRIKHQQRVEDWLRLHLVSAGVITARDSYSDCTTEEKAEITNRCKLVQTPGLITLLIDGKEVGTMADIVLPEASGDNG